MEPSYNSSIDKDINTSRQTEKPNYIKKNLFKIMIVLGIAIILFIILIIYLFSKSPIKYQNFVLKKTIKIDKADAYFLDDNILLLGLTNGQLAYFDTYTAEIVKKEELEHGDDSAVTTITKTASNKYLIGKSNGALVILFLEQERKSIRVFPNYIISTAELLNQNLVVLTGKTLYILDNENFDHVKEINFTNRQKKMLVTYQAIILGDSEGNVLVYDVDKYELIKNITTVKQDEPVDDPSINEIVELKHGSIAIGSGNKTVHILDSDYNVIHQMDGFDENVNEIIEIDNLEMIVAASKGNIIQSYDNSQFEKKNLLKVDTPISHVIRLIEDKIAVAGSGYITIYDGNTFNKIIEMRKNNAVAFETIVQLDDGTIVSSDISDELIIWGPSV